MHTHVMIGRQVWWGGLEMMAHFRWPPACSGVGGWRLEGGNELPMGHHPPTYQCTFLMSYSTYLRIDLIPISVKDDGQLALNSI